MPKEAEDAISNNGEARPKEVDRPDVAEDPLLASERKIDELTDTLKRTQAEFENYKKRIERDSANRKQHASEGLIADMLSVLDTLDKAVASHDPGSDDRNCSQGLEGVRRQFVQALTRAGVVEIRTNGQFDPFLHEAMMREETDRVDEGTIIEVFQKGYMLGPKVVRSAKVKVAVPAKTGTTDDETHDDINNDDTDEE